MNIIQKTDRATDGSKAWQEESLGMSLRQKCHVSQMLKLAGQRAQT